jgi:hypothetical protein
MSIKKNVLFLGEEYGDGQGTYIYPNGIMCVGEFKDGKRNGKGKLTSPYGEKYEGKWKEGEYDGQGTYIWSDGSKYVGENPRMGNTMV